MVVPCVSEIYMNRVDAVYVQSARKALSTSSVDTDAAGDRASRDIGYGSLSISLEIFTRLANQCICCDNLMLQIGISFMSDSPTIDDVCRRH